MLYTKGERNSDSGKFVVRDSLTKEKLEFLDSELLTRVESKGDIVGVHSCSGLLCFDSITPEVSKLLYLNEGDTISMFLPDVEVWLTLTFISFCNDLFYFKLGKGLYTITPVGISCGRYTFDSVHVNILGTI